MKLTELISVISPLNIIGETDKDIQAVQFDSRKVEPNTLFVAEKGTAADGHMFINKAIESGATAIVMDNAEYMPEATEQQNGVTYILTDSSSKALGLISHRFYGEPSKHLTLVGVTGTNGKTTIATLLYNMVRAMGYGAGLISTVVYKVNDDEYPSTHTTPDAPALNALLAKMVQAGCQYAFMEVSSHSIAQERIAGLQFAGALFTNLTRDHIDYHKTFDNYRDTKKRLFDNLHPNAFVVTNADDKNGLVMTQNTKAHVTTYSTQRMADYKGKILEEGFDGMLVTINGKEVFVPLIGRFNLSNLLCIYGTAMNLRFDELEVLRVLSTLLPVNGRFETIASPKGWTAIIDYAHTPDAVENVLNTINDIVHGKAEKSKVITVVGCGGNRDKGKRPMMAQIACRNSDQLILTSDNPRDEEPSDIINDMKTGLTDEQQKRTLIIEDRESAIKTACTLAQKGDVILIAGKGHENYQIIKGVKHHFDDHEVVRQYL